MLRHLGAKRTYLHNVKLASLLSLIAGYVNAAGFLAFAVLTTNVTGHAALFAEGIALQQWQNVRVIALWMFLFFAGAFISGLIVSRIGKNQQYSYVIPILIEIIILLSVALLGYRYDNSLVAREVFAGSLLFAMGLQNSLVSMVSGSVVRNYPSYRNIYRSGYRAGAAYPKKARGSPGIVNPYKASLGHHILLFIWRIKWCLRIQAIPVLCLFYTCCSFMLYLNVRCVQDKTKTVLQASEDFR